PPAHRQDAFRVICWLAAGAQYGLIAGALALVNLPRGDPPHERVEPEDRFDRHIYRREQIVVTADVTAFVCDERAYLGRRQAFNKSSGDQEHWPANADDAWFEHE